MLAAPKPNRSVDAQVAGKSAHAPGTVGVARRMGRLGNNVLRRLKLLWAFIWRAIEVPAYPSMVAVEVTNNCELKCIMCPRAVMTRPIGNMNPALFDLALEDMQGKTEFFWLQDCGEPLLHRNLFDMIERARWYGFRTGLSTSATNLGDSKSDRLLASGLDYIIFSVDGTTKETYESIRVGAKFENVMSNVRAFFRKKAASSSKLFAVVQCISMEKTRPEIEEFKRRWKVPGVDGVRIRQLAYSGIRKEPARRGKQRPCFYLWFYPVIKQDGTVVPCCRDYNAFLPLGNISRLKLGEAWNGEAMRRLRRLHVEGRQSEIPLCAACNVYQPNMAFAVASVVLPSFMVAKLMPRVETMLCRVQQWRSPDSTST